MLEHALSVLKKINDQGYEGYIVGGYVRDYLLKRNSTDIDITTNMPVNKLKKFYEIDTTNELYGSFILKFNEHVSFELTLFRKELSYNDQRHPVIELVDSYKEDYTRRDFTINAIAFDKSLNIFDYAQGTKDINERLVRTIRNADEVFKEDPVRILRAIYFKNKLNLDYEKQTYNGLLNNVAELKSISPARVYIELKKMCSDNLNHFISDLIETKAYKFLPLKEALLYIYKNEIIIESARDLLAVNFYLRNTIYLWGLSYEETKFLKKVALAILSDFSSESLFELNSVELEYASHMYLLIYKKDIRRDLLQKKKALPIRSNRDIKFKFNEAINYVENKKEIGVLKKLIISKILNFELKNENSEIIEFILAQKK